MAIQFPAGAIQVSLGSDGVPQVPAVAPLVRLDLWPTWLEIGCAHVETARVAGDRLTPDLTDIAKSELLTQELQAGLVAMTAFAFSLDGFYDTLKSELGPHPDEAAWKERGTARYKQVSETLRYRLKLGPTFSSQLRVIVKQLFDFRDRAVHPTSRFIDSNYRPQVDSSVHPHLITFSGPHVIQGRALVLEVFAKLIDRACELSTSGQDDGWLNRGKDELTRLSASYQVPGDDLEAFVTTTDVGATCE